MAIAVDASMFPLKGENPYRFPPVTCISQLLREVLQPQVMITLVAPDWQAAWRPNLSRVLLGAPLRLPTDSILSAGSTLPNLRLAYFRSQDRTSSSRPSTRIHRVDGKAVRQGLKNLFRLCGRNTRFDVFMRARIHGFPSILHTCRSTRLAISSCNPSISSSQTCGRTPTSATTSRR